MFYRKPIKPCPFMGCGEVRIRFHKVSFCAKLYVVRKTFLYRIFPTRKQATQMRGMLEECRWLYNYLLAQLYVLPGALTHTVHSAPNAQIDVKSVWVFNAEDGQKLRMVKAD